MRPSLSRFACSRRPASLRLRADPGRAMPSLGSASETLSCRIAVRPAFGGLAWQTKSPCHASGPPRRHTAHHSAGNAAGLRPGLFSGLRGSLCACSRALRASAFLARGAWPGGVLTAWHQGAVRTPPPTDGRGSPRSFSALWRVRATWYPGGFGTRPYEPGLHTIPHPPVGPVALESGRLIADRLPKLGPVQPYPCVGAGPRPARIPRFRPVPYSSTRGSSTWAATWAKSRPAVRASWRVLPWEPTSTSRDPGVSCWLNREERRAMGRARVG